jgi:hypothetical protein
MEQRAFVNYAFDRAIRAKLDPDFMWFGQDIFKAEDLIDRAYRVFCNLLVEQIVGAPGGNVHQLMADGHALLVHGSYLPCVRRPTYKAEVDRRNDGLPDYAGVNNFKRDSAGELVCYTYQVRRLDRFPRGIAPVVPGEPFRLVEWSRQGAGSNRSLRRRGAVGDTLQAHHFYFTVPDDDRIVHAIHTGIPDDYSAQWHAAMAAWPAIVFNSWADRRFLWQVETSEQLTDWVRTPLILGVDESHVKSLFYARSLPVTESGRRRPILHWVRAHERRLAEGIDVDVCRHLRGITEFDMDSMHFQITSPDKQAEKEARHAA